MKEALLKFAGFFVERVPVDPPERAAQAAASAPVAAPHLLATPAPGAIPVAPELMTQAIAVALRAWVPQEYAGYLAPYGIQVIAAGGDLTVDQARAYGAQVLIVSAECLGVDTHLLVSPQLPTVFVTPQPVLVPDATGVVQVQEPLRASEIAIASREALTAFASRR